MKCKHCGIEESSHCEFEAAFERPHGCNCEPRDWGNPSKIPAVCAAWKDDPVETGYCLTCEHERECHS